MIWLLLVACRTAPDPCETAWTELEGLRDGLAAHAEVQAPDREAFLAACAALPLDQRRCLSAATAASDPGCDGAIDALQLDADASTQ